MSRAAFFDVDGTLTRTNIASALGYYLQSLQNPLLGAFRVAQQVARLPLLTWAEAMDRGSFNEQLFAAYQGFSEDRLRVLADEVVDRLLLPGLFPGARQLVDACAAQGMTLVLISGSPDFLVKPFGQRLGFDERFCFGNRLEFVRNTCTGRILPPVLAGPRKAAMMRELADQHGWRLTDCYAYSDDSADAPMLSVVGHPAAVNPGPRLRRMAQSQRWPVIELS
ncbi:MAG: HAD-IB family hydrolase [Deltaproteobacteria bacterium]|nr:HAD-IB family hydrolase [Deltaproteobacteria bacterium]